MSDNVVAFPRPVKNEPEIWVCGCGCSTFEVHHCVPTPRIMCANCEQEIDELGGLFSLPHEKPWVGDAPFSDVRGNDCGDFGRRRFSEHVLNPETLMAGIVWRDGSVSVWCDQEVGDDVGWLEDRMIDMFDMVKRWVS